MNTKGYGNQHNDRGEQVHSLHISPSGRDVDAAEGMDDSLVASEVMGLTLELTWASAEIYQLVADLAEELGNIQATSQSASRDSFRQFPITLQEIITSNQNSERQIRRLESKIISNHPEILDAYLEDCWAALATCKEVSVNLAMIIGPDTEPQPAVAAARMLIWIMGRLKTCSKRVTGLPGTGIALACQSLLETACALQNRTGELVGKSVGPS